MDAIPRSCEGGTLLKTPASAVQAFHSHEQGPVDRDNGTAVFRRLTKPHQSIQVSHFSRATRRTFQTAFTHADFGIS
jgi:hypothetical protein